MANILTCMRILGTLVLLFLQPMSSAFYIVYSISGVTDVLDGFVARLTKTTSKLGAKLDSAADLLFYAVMLLLLLPTLWMRLPWWIWILVGIVLSVRLAAYVTAYVKTRAFSALHTILNKMTGLGVFLIPYFLQTELLTGYCLVVGSVGFLSSTHELIIHLREKAC